MATLRDKNIYLTGFMGSGKTAVGRVLARRLGRRFVDTDALIERGAKKSVAKIFAENDEARFRSLEREAVAALGRKRGLVVALGGGALLDARNRRVAEGGVLVAISCAEPELWRRLRPEISRRPLLSGGRAALRALLRRRRGAYAGAQLCVSTTRRSPAAAARLIAARLAR